ncbi:hypothetical protein EBZ39_04625 [bacterium]|nr:hypothetical protein [bacterium]
MAAAAYNDDELARRAGYYNARINVHLNELRTVLARERELEQGLTYREFLDIQRVFEQLRESMVIRDAMGTHSPTERELYRWISHPNKNPKPAWLDEVNDPAPV